MTERDYIIVSNLIRIRDAYGILRDVCPENIARVIGATEARTMAEWQHTMACLDTWRARLEWTRRTRGEPDKEPWLRQFPCAAEPSQ